MNKQIPVTVSAGGMGVFSWVGLILVTLKLTKVISWSWWLVTSPFWAMPALCCVALLAAIAVCLIMTGICALLKRLTVP